ncbi:N-acetylglucosamine-6-phosphate deacetylase [Panacibacter sp. DH6]|uniref:N-acetylglucosamine-6-phosphate deacetylase n=1 Tax=Panacibacter microcysteis TaxID=2793269 RepID=A0A931E6Y6_9BACT|nr:N-acetylglucosamine-6-phosphate deacetylase [Panacibacter microcysteis]MBG9375429.1 N-acetylglucosamine-6-phosphate deacetylase [Panacibacter microcysteis]
MIYKAAAIFTGFELLHNYAVKVSGGIIEALISANDVNADDLEDLGDVILAPAFIDIQLYGAYGRLLSVYPDAFTVSEIVRYSKSGGAAWCLPTVATNTYENIFKCIDAVRSYLANGGDGVLGLHVEGPWLNAEKRGAHKEEWIFSPSLQQVKELLDYGEGVIKLITLAPEKVAGDVIAYIQSRGIVVSAGHSNATYEQAMRAFEQNNIDLCTHLFNAMSALQHRAPGLVGAIFNANVMSSIVPDGYHVHFAAVQIAKKIMGERLFAITDAVTETTEGYYQHTREGEKYVSNGILSGSALTMYKAFRNFVEHCDIEPCEALRMCGYYPAKAMNITDSLGTVAKGKKAVFILLTTDYRLKGML